jgi:hypothetical protein
MRGYWENKGKIMDKWENLGQTKEKWDWEKLWKIAQDLTKLENGKTKFLLFLGSLPKRVGHSSPIHLFFVVEAFYNALQDLINARLD